MSSETASFEDRVRFTTKEIDAEHHRIVDFLRRNLGQDPAVCAVSGGLDSDVSTRLVVEAIGRERVKLFIVEQDDFDARFLRNAASLASDLALQLITIDLRGMPLALIGAMRAADPAMSFRVDGVLDVGRAKCSLRTALLSTYQDRGYRVVGNSNRTEWLTGFYLPFGDGLAHVQPIIHLYAGGPIRHERSYTEDELARIYGIREQLNRELLDAVIDALMGGVSAEQIAADAGLPIEIVKRLQSLLTSARWKHVPMFERVV